MLRGDSTAPRGIIHNLTHILKENKMKNQVLVVSLCVLFISVIASADVVQEIDIEFVSIGNQLNAADITGYGAVNYTYRIGKYEVTNGQWDTFVSAAGAPTGNPNSAYDETSAWAGSSIPVTRVSWYEAAQFCNYLTSGSKSQGAYQFSNGNFVGIDRDLAISVYGTAYVIPTEDEWYKAAYFTGSGYSKFANGTDTVPVEDVDSNFHAYIGTTTEPWNVGTGKMEQNGTFDMMGNVFEWNETLINNSSRGIRGGAYGGGGMFGTYINSSYRSWTYPENEGFGIGFRVASVPEPCSLIVLGLGGLALRRRIIAGNC